MPSNKVKRKIICPWTEEDMEKAIMLVNSARGFDFDLGHNLTCLACKSSGIYPVDCFQQGARTSRFGAKPPAPQFYKVATTSR